MTELPSEFDTVPPEFDQDPKSGIEDPPTGFWGTLIKLGPGLIIAGSIVGSGELIGTTKTGAQAGISLLWLIILGCLIKVFVQIELGRYAITHGQTTLNALNQVPGRIGPVNFIVWFWLAMMIAGMAQLGGIVGGVGQSMAISCPITGDYREAVVVPTGADIAWFLAWDADLQGSREKWNRLTPEEQSRVTAGYSRLQVRLAELGARGQQAIRTIQDGGSLKDPWTWDDRIWAALVTVITVAVLFNGRYGILQTLSTILVVAFTFLTLGNVISLQMTDEYSLSTADFLRGLSFSLPGGDDPWKAIQTALATFGIIGVGATELITYPYWCIEKGYARSTGRWSADEAWAARARGWIRVMKYDAFLSMVVYTLATVAFYIMGVTVLHREGRDPDGMRMVVTLASAYVPIFGDYAKWLFLIGAFAVLYSTFLVANAGHARMFTDSLKVFGLIDRNSQRIHDETLSTFCVALPLICLAFFWSGINPVQAILLAGMMQATMLPMLGLAAIYFRRTATDPRLAPSRLWDVMLGLSCLGLLITGVWGVIAYVQKTFG